MNGKVGIVLGSGLGGFAESVEDAVATPYSAIPNWPRPKASAIEGHAGQLIEGRVGGQDVAVLAGRNHLYEGYTAQEVVFGVRELARRGVTHLILTNSAGGLDNNYKTGDLVLIADHINLTGVNPLAGPNDDRLGPRFPDMSEAYPQELRELAKAEAAGMGMILREGVYAGLTGPCFETPAEIQYLRTIGADLVGMSTVLETIAAHHLGIRVLGISTVSNMAAGILPQKLTHQEVLETGERVKEPLTRLLRAVVEGVAHMHKP